MQKLVKAKTRVSRLEDDGSRKVYEPGQYFYARNMEVKTLLAIGQIEQPCDVVEIHGLEDCGVVVLNGDLEGARGALQQAGLRDLPVAAGNYQTSLYLRTLFWDTAAPLRPDLIYVGLSRLGNGWQMAAPLLPYELLAANVGTPAERAQTAAVIHDLRVPLYDPRVVFANAAGRAVLSAMETTGDRRLALLRAIYQAKPIICALPKTWVR